MARAIDGNRPLGTQVEGVPAAEQAPSARGATPTPVDIRDDSLRAAQRAQPPRGAAIHRLGRALRMLLRKETTEPVRRNDSLRRAWHDLVRGGDVDSAFPGRLGSDAWIDDAKATRLMRPDVDHVELTRAELDPLLDQRRRVLTAMFNGVCMDVHARVASVLDDVAAARRMQGWRRHVPELVSADAVFARYQSPRPDYVLQQGLDAGIMQREPDVLVATSKWFGNVPGTVATTLSLPVGDHGRELTEALMFAAQTMMGAARKTKLSPSGRLKELARKFTFQGSSARTNPYRASAVEGVVSIAQIVALLTARQVPGKDLETLLDDTFRPLLQLAVTAPFGSLAPLANHGYTPHGPMTFDEAGRACVPDDLQAMVAIAQRDRVIPAKGEPVGENQIAGGMNETRRGCPVAFGSPTIGADGKLTFHDAGLHVLTADFIALAKLHLRAQRAS